MTRQGYFIVAALVLLFSLSWPGSAHSAEWAEVLRIEVGPGDGRFACPTQKGWTVLLEPEGERLAVFASRIMAPDGPFDDIRLVFETVDGKRHEAASVSSAGGSNDSGAVLQSGLYLNPEDCKRGDIRAVVIEQLTTEGLAMAEARKKAEAEAVTRAQQTCPLPAPEVGKPFPFTLTSTTGEELASTALTGKVVVLEFWASWCGPCVGELPALKALYKKHEADGLRIIGISLDDDRERLDGAIKKFEVPWPQVFIGDQTRRMALIQQTGTSRIPRYFVIDKQGILHTDRGRGQLETMIPGLLDK